MLPSTTLSSQCPGRYARHTACGAIQGGIDGARLGNLTGLLNKIKPAVDATHYEGERTSKNGEFVDEAAKTNVRLTMSARR